MTSFAPEEERELLRDRRTLFLLITGGLSLLIPLIVVLYIRYSDSFKIARPGAPASMIFQRRGDDGSFAPKIAPAEAPAPSSPNGPLAQVPGAVPRENSPAPVGSDASAPPGGSLSFVRGGEDYYKERSAAAMPAPPPAQVPIPAPQHPPPAPKEVSAQAKKTGPKSFAMPKLKATNGFNSMYSNGQTAPQNGALGQQDPAAVAAAAAALAAKQQEEHDARYGKSARGAGSGANLPTLGSSSSQKTGAQTPAMPDIDGMLKNLPGASQR